MREMRMSRAGGKPLTKTRKRSLKVGAAFLIVAALILAFPNSAFAQEAEPADPLITGDNLLILLIVVVAGAMILLGLMAYATLVREVTGNREEFLPLVQGMVLVTVVVAVILLGISGKVTEEGLATILAAIVGFAVGRATTGNGT
jgi:hypothetical protein